MHDAFPANVQCNLLDILGNAECIPIINWVSSASYKKY